MRWYHSLRFKLAAAFSALMVVTAAFLFPLMAKRLRDSGEQLTRERAGDIALILAHALGPALERGGGRSAESLLASLATTRGAQYGAVLRQDGSVLAAWNAQRLPREIAAPGDAQSIELRGNLLRVSNRVVMEDGTHGVLAIGFSLEQLSELQSRNLAFVIMAALLAVIIGSALAAALGSVIVRPITRLRRITGDIVRTGELSTQIPVSSHDEVGALAESFGEMVGWLRHTVETLSRIASGLTRAIRQMKRVGDTVANGAGTIQTGVDVTSSAMVQMRDALRAVGNSMTVLEKSAEDGGSTVLEMATTNDEVAGNVASMADSVRQTATFIERLTVSITEIAHSIEEFNRSTTETSASMTELDASIREVKRSAGDTAKLAEQFTQDAELGVAALDRTVEGIEAIRSSAATTSSVMEQLGGSVAQIGTIVSVIDDITKQTSLLALNAAIIASQAGEHGRGFSVVADEIRDLAERTSASTTEIAALVHTIQEDTEKAASAVVASVHNVQQGMDLGRQAGTALASILESSVQAKNMAVAIARATDQQAEATSQVSRTIQRVAQTVQELTAASRQQAEGAQEIRQRTSDMSLLTQQVQQSSKEQAGGSQRAIQAIEKINGMIERVSASHQQQSTAGEEVLRAVEAIQTVAAEQNRSASSLEQTISLLEQQADELQEAMQRFNT